MSNDRSCSPPAHCDMYSVVGKFDGADVFTILPPHASPHAQTGQELHF